MNIAFFWNPKCSKSLTYKNAIVNGGVGGEEENQETDP